MSDSKVLIDKVAASIGEVIYGKDQEIRLAICCLLARGHLLIEDLPGVGKTTLAQVLARVTGLDYQRVQFTSDLLPADVTGISIFDQASSSFEFHAGPLFSQVVLADEVNRATPKAQSALLEAMEEYQVTVDGKTHPLPSPFFVIATQNPFHQIGTFPLPESQLDRFLIRIHLGYPNENAERELLKGRDRRLVLQDMKAVIEPQSLIDLQQETDHVQVSDPILDYVQALLLHSRNSPHFSLGLSPRAGLALLQAARAWALMAGRNMVVPDDLQAVLHGVVAHRLRTTAEADEDDLSDAASKLIRGVPVLAA